MIIYLVEYWYTKVLAGVAATSMELFSIADSEAGHIYMFFYAFRYLSISILNSCYELRLLLCLEIRSIVEKEQMFKVQ